MPAAPARPRLILHIGTHKTATTALQDAMQQGREPWRAAGVLLPRTDREPWPHLPKHSSVYAAAASDDPARVQHERELLLAEFEGSGAHTMVITEEGLSEPDACLPAFFAPWADRFAITVVCAFRRPDLFVESLYNQFVREPARLEARDIAQFARAPVTCRRLDYPALLQGWLDIGAQVRALSYDTLGPAAAVVPAFTEAAHLPPLPASPDAVNPSPDMNLILVLRQLRRLRCHSNLPVLLQAAQALTAAQRFPPCRHLLGRDLRQELLQELAPMMARMTSEHGMQFESRLPPDEPAGPTDQPPAAYVAELLAEVSLRVRPRA